MTVKSESQESGGFVMGKGDALVVDTIENDYEFEVLKSEGDMLVAHWTPI